MSEQLLSTYSFFAALTENGTVARGICEIDKNRNLISITERTKIKKIVWWGKGKGPNLF